MNCSLGSDIDSIRHNLLNKLPIGIAVFDVDIETLYVNNTASEILETKTDVIGKLQKSLIPGRCVDWQTVLKTTIESRQAIHYSAVAIPKSGGGQYTVNISIQPQTTGKNDRCSGVALIIEDISCIADIEKKLANTESMAAVGKLAAKVAHELNNPLDGTLRYINLCSRILADNDNEKIRNYLEQARQGLTRMAQTVGDLLEFSRNTPMLNDNGNINWIIEEAIHSLSDHADNSNIVVTADFRDDKLMPSIPGTKLYQVCCNLIKNAIDAMPDGGTLSISSGIINEQVVIRFSDTGEGLPEETQKIFEPFYTTKPTGKGTGLGLAICKEYIEQLGGTITAKKGNGSGAILTVILPLSCETNTSNCRQQTT